MNMQKTERREGVELLIFSNLYTTIQSYCICISKKRKYRVKRAKNFAEMHLKSIFSFFFFSEKISSVIWLQVIQVPSTYSTL